MLEEDYDFQDSYVSNNSWEVFLETHFHTIISSLQFIDSTPPKVTSGTEFTFYEEELPLITLKIEEKHLGTYTLYRDLMLVDTGSWNSSELTLFLEKLPKGTYYYDLYLTGKMGNNAFVKLTLHVLEPKRPSPPTKLVVSIHTQGVFLNWSPPEDDGGSQIINYVIYRRLINQTSYAKLGNSTTTYYIDKNVTLGESYFYVVMVVNKIGESLPSNEVQITITITVQFSVTLTPTNGKSGSSGFLPEAISTTYISLGVMALFSLLRRKRKK